jgi:hypothetical protein
MDRRQPDAADAKIFQIIQLGENSLEIPDAVAVRIREGGDEDLIVRFDTTSLPPRFPVAFAKNCDILMSSKIMQYTYINNNTVEEMDGLCDCCEKVG